MNLTDPRTLRSLLERHGLRPTKRYGQHFLISDRVVEAILGRCAGMEGFLEVGPGIGVLTQRLSAIGPTIAVEIDPIAVSVLSETVPQATIVHQDVLRVDLTDLAQQIPRPRALVSNMPYQITGPLLGRVSELRPHLDRAVLMMQKEVAGRILAMAGSKEFGSLSVFLQSQFTVRTVCQAPPGAFFPPPKVESTVLELEPKELGFAPDVESTFFRLVRQGFAQPRKTLANNLTCTHADGRRGVLRILSELGLSPSIRPHEVDIAKWKHLAQRWYDAQVGAD